MGRLERRLFKINDEIEHLSFELHQARAELDVHLHLADDAARDAAVYDTPFDREDARETSADVERFHRLVSELSNRIERLVEKRSQLLERLG